MEGRLTRVAGLCARCVHVRMVTSGRGSTFFLCGKSATDERYPKYPALPVLHCAGFVLAAAPPAPGGASPAPGGASPAPGEASPSPGEASPSPGEASPSQGSQR